MAVKKKAEKRKTRKKKETLNAGVVGLRMGREHADGFGKSKANLLAVCDIDAAKVKAVQEEFAVPMAFADFDEMLAREELDVVSIAVPNHLHEPHKGELFDMVDEFASRRPHPIAADTIYVTRRRQPFQGAYHTGAVQVAGRFSCDDHYLHSDD